MCTVPVTTKLPTMSTGDQPDKAPSVVSATELNRITDGDLFLVVANNMFKTKLLAKHEVNLCPVWWPGLREKYGCDLAKKLCFYVARHSCTAENTCEMLPRQCRATKNTCEMLPRHTRKTKILLQNLKSVARMSVITCAQGPRHCVASISQVKMYKLLPVLCKTLFHLIKTVACTSIHTWCKL